MELFVNRILVVEDNDQNRDMIARYLRLVGFEVLVAANGVEGFSQAQQGHPDLILLDMSLPVMDGWETARRLKADTETQAIPVIALTAHAMVGDRERALEAGCDDYESKPVDLNRLTGKINGYLKAS